MLLGLEPRSTKQYAYQIPHGRPLSNYLLQVSEAKAKTREFDAKVTKTAAEAEAKYKELKAEAGAKFDETRKETSQAIDNFDKTVVKKAAEAKTGISSWLGFGKQLGILIDRVQSFEI